MAPAVLAPLFYLPNRFSTTNRRDNQILVDGNRAPCAGIAGKKLCRDCALLNAQAHAQQSCVKNQLARL